MEPGLGCGNKKYDFSYFRVYPSVEFKGVKFVIAVPSQESCSFQDMAKI